MDEKSSAESGSIDLYTGFSPLSRQALSYWADKITSLGGEGDFFSALEGVNSTLLDGNLVMLFDHHYAFDAFPLALAMGGLVKNISSVILPYAVHLDMALGRGGEPSLRYRLRTRAFHWIKNHITRGNPQIHFYPVAREFELETPRLKTVVDKEYDGINTTYLKNFIRTFSDNPSGNISFLSPFAGIGFPDKPVLHPQLFRSIQMVRARSKHKISYCITGAYPDWGAYQSFIAPMLMQHRIVLSRLFHLPTGEYEEARDVVNSKLTELRRSAGFTPPDYEKILLK